jgi:hypothetical protein
MCNAIIDAGAMLGRTCCPNKKPRTFVIKNRWAYVLWLLLVKGSGMLLVLAIISLGTISVVTGCFCTLDYFKSESYCTAQLILWLYLVGIFSFVIGFGVVVCLAAMRTSCFVCLYVGSFAPDQYAKLPCGLQNWIINRESKYVKQNLDRIVPPEYHPSMYKPIPVSSRTKNAQYQTVINDDVDLV